MAAVAAPATVATLAAVIGPTTAGCSDCPWTRAGEGRRAWLATRAAARRHVATLGHQVVVGVVTFHTYAEVPADGPR